MRSFYIFIFIFLGNYTLSAQNWDINTLHRINKMDSKFVRGYSKTFSYSAPYISIGVPIALAIYGGIDKDKKKLQDALYIGTSVIEATALTITLKYAIDRERPYNHYPNRVHPYSLKDSPSFPSGHTSSAFALATSLCIKYPKWYVIAPSAIWACSVGFSRMNEGVHYPSDVIAGAIIGSGCAVINVYLNKWLNEKSHKKRRVKAQWK